MGVRAPRLAHRGGGQERGRRTWNGLHLGGMMEGIEVVDGLRGVCPGALLVVADRASGESSGWNALDSCPPISSPRQAMRAWGTAVSGTSSEGLIAAHHRPRAPASPHHTSPGSSSVLPAQAPIHSTAIAWSSPLRALRQDGSFAPA